MAVEIERKFHVVSDAWRPLVIKRTRIVQGYFLGGEKGIVRVRSQDNGPTVFTFKGRSNGLSRSEVEFGLPIPDGDLEDLLAMCDGRIEKTRHLVPHHQEPDLIWEIDEFHGPNEGLIVAEIELDREGRKFKRPPWIGQEITEGEYDNANLVRHPFSAWR